MAILIIFVILPILFVLLLIVSLLKKNPIIPPDKKVIKKILDAHVVFYKHLSAKNKLVFKNRVFEFLKTVKVTGVGIQISDMDKVFVGCGAIIPVFTFDNWRYSNIREVLIYPNAFTQDFDTKGAGRNVLGMVGTGYMQNVMVLSQQSLRNGFLNLGTKTNTAIHEFVHLIDKTDGETDGCPSNLLPHVYIVPWLKCIHREIELIQSGKSDINSYGAVSEAEFLAVASEYFFEQPNQMHLKHPELFRMMKTIFIKKKKWRIL